MTEDSQVYVNMLVVYPTRMPAMHLVLGIPLVGFHGINAMYAKLDDAIRIFKIESADSKPGVWKNYHTEMLAFFEQAKAGKVNLEKFSFPDSIISATLDLWETFDPSKAEKKKIRDRREKLKRGAN